MTEKPRSDQERFYGRRKGRPLNKSRQEALSLLDDIGLGSHLLSDGEVDPASVFSADVEKVVLEIGFGNGDFLAATHHTRPETGFIGAEPYINGVAALLKEIADHDTGNIRIWPDDVRPLLQAIKPGSIDRVYVLNPDPWPKKRHHKRRIINPDNLDMLARIMKPGAALFMTTDIDNLAEWMTMQIVNHPDFRWDIKALSDSTTPPDGWQPTRYEIKGQKAGRNQYYLTGVRR